MNDRLEKKPPAPGRRISIALAIAVHLVLAIFLFYGVHWQSERPEAVEVELVRALPEPSAPAPAPAPEVKPEPRPKPPPPPPPEPKPAPREPEIAVKEKPKPPPKEMEKPKPPPKEVPKPTAKGAPNPFADALKKEDEQRARNEAAAAADKELQQIESARSKSAAESAMAAYLGKIRSKIRGNILLPPGVKGNPEAVFDVTQLPSGEILSVRLKQSSGHGALDSAIERAILKSSPLPKPDNPGLFQRQLVLSFKPLDE